MFITELFGHKPQKIEDFTFNSYFPPKSPEINFMVQVCRYIGKINHVCVLDSWETGKPVERYFPTLIYIKINDVYFHIYPSYCLDWLQD